LQDRKATPNQTSTIPNWAIRLLVEARVGHLACSTKDGRPLVIPVCFTFHEAAIFSAIDEKPKRAPPFALRRISNITENPKVCFTVDQYSENWRRLQYVLVDGLATVLSGGKEFTRVISRLRRKYKQYRSMKLESRPIIKIKPTHIVAWTAKGIRSPGTLKPKAYH
jgi:PPOX class probable F420-dependent enzyme